MRNDEYLELANGQVAKIKGYVVINKEDIEETMNDLRMLIGSIASTYEEGNDEFADVYPDEPLAEFDSE
jgi:hypothetical protein